MPNSPRHPAFHNMAISWVIAELQNCEKQGGPSVAEESSLSLLAEDSPRIRLPRRVDVENISIDSILGDGGFSVVYKVNVTHHDEEMNGCFAMKCLAASKLATHESFLMAVRDLYNEATLLSRLDHPNVISLRGVPRYGLIHSFFARPELPGYFLILDRLQETLRDRIDQWKAQQSRFFKKSGSGKLGSGNTPSNSDWDTRFDIAADLGRGLQYVHSQGIVLRDLKPENVGFDSNGILKIFDFGLARQHHDCFTEGAIAGSFRFMAPEGILCQPSGYPADVYSFGVLLWEVATLQRPYESYFVTDKTTKRVVFEQSKFTTQVILNEWRPPVMSIYCEDTRQLIQQCWVAAPENRPTFDVIVKTMTTIQERRRAAARVRQQPVLQRAHSVKTLGMSSRKASSPKRGLFRTFSDQACSKSKNQYPPATVPLRAQSSRNLMAVPLDPISSSCSDEQSATSSFAEDTQQQQQQSSSRGKPRSSASLTPPQRSNSFRRMLGAKTPSARNLVRNSSSSGIPKESTSSSGSELKRKKKKKQRDESLLGQTSHSDKEASEEKESRPPQRSNSFRRMLQKTPSAKRLVRTLSSTSPRMGSKKTGSTDSTAPQEGQSRQGSDDDDKTTKDSRNAVFRGTSTMQRTGSLRRLLCKVPSTGKLRRKLSESERTDVTAVEMSQDFMGPVSPSGEAPFEQQAPDTVNSKDIASELYGSDHGSGNESASSSGLRRTKSSTRRRQNSNGSLCRSHSGSSKDSIDSTGLRRPGRRRAPAGFRNLVRQALQVAEGGGTLEGESNVADVVDMIANDVGNGEGNVQNSFNVVQ